MRARLVAIMIALAVLAFAEIRHDDPASPGQLPTDARLGDPPAPEPDVPAIIGAAASTAATVQTILVVASKRQVGPDLRVFTVSRHLPVVTHNPGKPRFFPLLI